VYGTWNQCGRGNREDGGLTVVRGAAICVAIVPGIHRNLTAFEAVLANLAHTSPDLVLHGRDLADGESGPMEIDDRIPDLGRQGRDGQHR
jgi:hypothetical protein